MDNRYSSRDRDRMDDWTRNQRGAGQDSYGNRHERERDHLSRQYDRLGQENDESNDYYRDPPSRSSRGQDEWRGGEGAYGSSQGSRGVGSSGGPGYGYGGTYRNTNFADDRSYGGGGYGGRSQSRDYGDDPGSQSYGSRGRAYASQAYGAGSQSYGQQSGGYDRDSQGGYGQGAHRGRGPQHYQRSDERIREDVNDRLTDHADIDASGINVSVQKCEVTLSGTVDSRSAKRLAEDCAGDVSGVKHVQNNLRVADGTAASSLAGGQYAQGTAGKSSAGSSGTKQ